MFDLLYIRQFTDQFIIAASEPVHDRIFFAARLDPDNDLIAILPFMDILRDQFHRILKICDHGDHAVTGYLKDSIIWGVELSKVSRIEDRLDLRVLCTEHPEQFSRLIRGVIVDKDQLVVVLRQLFCDDADDRFTDRNDILLLVIAWNQNADFFHVIFSSSLNNCYLIFNFYHCNHFFCFVNTGQCSRHFLSIRIRYAPPQPVLPEFPRFSSLYGPFPECDHPGNAGLKVDFRLPSRHRL